MKNSLYHGFNLGSELTLGWEKFCRLALMFRPMFGRVLLASCICWVLFSCSSSINQAPVIDRLPSRNIETPGAGHAMVSTDGFYTVKPGDTLYAIALEFGQDWRELARVNNIADPGKLVVGQRLRVENLSLANNQAGIETSNGVVEVSPVAPQSAPSGSPKVNVTPVPVETNPGFVMPHPGDIIQAYKPGVNKGIDFAAKVGDPVVAAQAGKVVYSGNALRGYGNLIILKHDNNILTAYAHNKTLLVKEGEVVTKGQKIAEAGQSDAERPKLHFEVRKQGKPVDPADYLPKR